MNIINSVQKVGYLSRVREGLKTARSWNGFNNPALNRRQKTAMMGLSILDIIATPFRPDGRVLFQKRLGYIDSIAEIKGAMGEIERSNNLLLNSGVEYVLTQHREGILNGVNAQVFIPTRDESRSVQEHRFHSWSDYLQLKTGFSIGWGKPMPGEQVRHILELFLSNPEAQGTTGFIETDTIMTLREAMDMARDGRDNHVFIALVAPYKENIFLGNEAGKYITVKIAGKGIGVIEFKYWPKGDTFLEAGGSWAFVCHHYPE